MIPQEKLQIFDYKLLRYIKKNQPVSIASIIFHYPKLAPDSLRYRIELLSRRDLEYHNPLIPTSVPNTNYIQTSSSYSMRAGDDAENFITASLTALGEKVVQDRSYFRIDRFWTTDFRSYLALVISALALLRSWWDNLCSWFDFLFR